ncbi:radical SAM protein [Paenibacillus sp. P26]|nr:radical SAM protein [Paenibacillus sp. P26]
MKPTVTTRPASRSLNPASGYLTGYSHTLNPYAGCAFACSYCYVREMPVAKFRGEAWGTWVDVKEDAAPLLAKELQRAKRKGPVTVFMSSSTDPYQPVEYRTRLTRSLLEVMAEPETMPDFLLVQTRDPLVTRDIDLLQRLGSRVRVSLTVETDLEPVRKAFSPAAPPIAARFQALRRLTEAGIPAQAAVSPVPCSGRFTEALAATGVSRLCVDDYFMGDGDLGRRTERLGIRRIYEVQGLESWYDPQAYRTVLEQPRRHFTEEQILVSQAGFLP